MTAEIVLCSFNGERFLQDQLESIARQTRLPDRVLALDDSSTDKSVRVLKDFGSRLPLEIEVNGVRLGPVANFERALSKSKGDVVFLCDQDDVWDATKIERMLNHLQVASDLLLLGSDALLIDGKGRTDGRHLLAILGGREASKWAPTDWFVRLLRRNLVTGATIAVRRELLEIALPIPPGYWHDEWLGLVAAGLGKLGWHELPLMRYRLHEGNASGLAGVGLSAVATGAVRGGKHHHAWRAAKLDALADRLKRVACEVPDEHWRLLDEARCFWHRRAAPASSRAERWQQAARTLRAGLYHRYADGAKSFARDLLS